MSNVKLYNSNERDSKSLIVVQTRFVSLPTMLRNKQSMQPADICFSYSSSYLLIYSFTFIYWFLVSFSQRDALTKYTHSSVSFLENLVCAQVSSISKK